MNNELKSWFVVDFANVNIEDEKKFADFIKKWTPEEHPPHTAPEMLYLDKMVDVAREAGAEESEWIPLLTGNRNLFLSYQNEIKRFLKNFQETAEQNLKQPIVFEGKTYENKIVSDELLEDLREKLKKIRFTIRSIATINSSAKLDQLIMPDLKDFETCLFYDFSQYVSANSMLLVCEACKNYISNPSKSQFSNARRGLAALHATDECRKAHNLKKDNERNKKKYKKKKENAK